MRKQDFITTICAKLLESMSRMAFSYLEEQSGSIAYNPDSTPSRRDLRRLLQSLLVSDSDFDAFVLDYFPEIKGRFTNCMDRVCKTNLLLEHAHPGIVLLKLRQALPETRGT